MAFCFLSSNFFYVGKGRYLSQIKLWPASFLHLEMADFYPEILIVSNSFSIWFQHATKQPTSLF